MCKKNDQTVTVVLQVYFLKSLRNKMISFFFQNSPFWRRFSAFECKDELFSCLAVANPKLAARRYCR